MIKINFGISNFSRYSPGVPWEERTMEIPEEQELPKIEIQYVKRPDPREVDQLPFDLYDYLDVREDKYKFLPAVRFELVAEHSHSRNYIYLIWIEIRSEWISVWHREWSEIDFSIDESENGPYALDIYCKDMLAKAYGVIRERMPKDIAKISPVELERLTGKEISISAHPQVCT
jgi:hypothetical protein